MHEVPVFQKKAKLPKMLGYVLVTRYELNGKKWQAILGSMQGGELAECLADAAAYTAAVNAAGQASEVETPPDPPAAPGA